jgi:hypothetical protein
MCIQFNHFTMLRSILEKRPKAYDRELQRQRCKNLQRHE